MTFVGMTFFEGKVIAVSENKTETLMLRKPDKTSVATSVVLPAPGHMFVLRRPSYCNAWAALFEKALTSCPKSHEWPFTVGEPQTDRIYVVRYEDGPTLSESQHALRRAHEIDPTLVMCRGV